MARTSTQKFPFGGKFDAGEPVLYGASISEPGLRLSEKHEQISPSGCARWPPSFFWEVRRMFGGNSFVNPIGNIIYHFLFPISNCRIRSCSRRFVRIRYTRKNSKFVFVNPIGNIIRQISHFQFRILGFIARSATKLTDRFWLKFWSKVYEQLGSTLPEHSAAIPWKIGNCGGHFGRNLFVNPKFIVIYH